MGHLRWWGMADGTAQQKLTPKQEHFVAAYIGVSKGNATDAARRAGYKNPERQGYENVRKPAILARVTDFATAKKEYADADQVLRALTDVGLSEWRDHIEVDDGAGGRIKVKMDLGNKVKALELLGKFHQLFADRQIVEGELVTRVYVGMDPDDFDAEADE